jgi:hypothetical protein
VRLVVAVDVVCSQPVDVGIGERAGRAVDRELLVPLLREATFERAGDLAARRVVLDAGNVVCVDEAEELAVVELGAVGGGARRGLPEQEHREHERDEHPRHPPRANRRLRCATSGTR